MITNIKEYTKVRMDKCIEAFNKQINKIRGGRAVPGMLDDIIIKHYNKIIPINQLTSITIEDARTLKINVFDQSTKSKIEKALMNSNLNLNPISAGTNIRIVLPLMTEDRRKFLLKVIRENAEQSKIAIRNIRKDTNNKIRTLTKNKEINKNENYFLQKIVQDITNKAIKRIDEVLTAKELELMKF